MKNIKLVFGSIVIFLGCLTILTACDDKGYVVKENGDIHITESGVTLSDMDVDGDLFIDETVGDGDFTLKNIAINGTLYVRGGGENSGYLVNVFGTDMIVESKDGTRVVCTNSGMDGVQLLTSCNVDNVGSDIKKVTVGSSETERAINVLMTGDYPEVTFESTANVKIDGKVSLMTVLENAGMTSIEMVDESTCYFYSCYGQSVTITGGTIIEAWINAEYCSLPENTDFIGSNTGVANVTLGDVLYDIPGSEGEEQGEEDEGPEEPTTDSFFSEGYPIVSKNGSVITILSACETQCTIYASVEGDEVGLEGISSDNILHPEKFNDDPNYIPITGSVVASSTNEIYTITIDMEKIFPDDMNMGAPEGGFAVFVIAEDADGEYSPISRFVVNN
ncbi:MAG: hypothetical protein JW817_07695 [Clostridiales bacterium]|nr:hypothetical protein [Clostridiales bacterium]